MAEKSCERLLLTVREAAALLGYSKTLLYNLLNRGELPCVRLGRTARIPRAWLEKWIEEQVSNWEKVKND